MIHKLLHICQLADFLNLHLPRVLCFLASMSVIMAEYGRVVIIAGLISTSNFI